MDSSRSARIDWADSMSIPPVMRAISLRSRRPLKMEVGSRKPNGRTLPAHRLQCSWAAGIGLRSRRRRRKEWVERNDNFTQPDRLQIGKISPELVEAGGAGAPKTINGLIRVADDEKAASVFRPVTHQTALHSVDILKLVHKQIIKHMFAFAVNVQRVQKNVVQIARTHSGTALYVFFTNTWFNPRRFI